jgi:hypothetical protein
MWFGGNNLSPRSLSLVSTFITGFQHGQEHPRDPLRFEYFTRWVAARYRVNDGAMNGFALILEKVEHDEGLAFDEFFKLLPDFIRDMEQHGPESIHAHYMTVMDEIRKRHDA